MYCKNCGTPLESNISYCPNCGTPVEKAPDVNEPYQYVPQEPVKPETDGYAIASLVLGILGFFILPLIGGILAIVFGNKSIRENGMNTMARVGKILGIICLILYIIVVIIIIAAIVLLGVSTAMDYVI